MTGKSICGTIAAAFLLSAPSGASAAMLNAGPVPNGGGSQTMQCTLTNLSDTVQSVEIRVFDIIGNQVGRLSSPSLDPGRTTWIGVNSIAATRCQFEASGAAASYIATACLKSSIEEITTACVNAVPVAEEILPPGKR